MKSIFLFIFATSLFAAPISVRWTGAEDPNPELLHILANLQQKTGITLGVDHLIPIENRNLATSHFTMYAQGAAGLPMRGHGLRIWTELDTGKVIQVEARVDTAPKLASSMVRSMTALSSQFTFELVRRSLRSFGIDRAIRDITWTDYVENSEVVRLVTVKALRGKHEIRIQLSTQHILNHHYEEYPNGDAETFSVPARIYPIYEEVEGEGTLLPRIETELRYLSSNVKHSTTDPLIDLKSVRYFDSLFDPLKGLTAQGRKEGFWAMAYLKEQAQTLLQKIPASPNGFEAGVALQGQYATVSLYPDAVQKFPNLAFSPRLSAQFLPVWKATPEDPNKWEMLPSTAFLGKPVQSLADAWNRPAQRLPNHDPQTYINDGFDELQVYWAVTQMFDSLRPMGFSDPELSTRPFHAYLYYPDIEYRDNAFYTDDTINFTTYSPKSSNMARDNTTIWHELGHGVMDRLMGDHIRLADTGGLSEGMADFVAQLVINDLTGGLPFQGKEKMRIFNKTGFYLTSESHDDGEAYGGAMNDLLVLAMNHEGRPGLVKVTDLVLESMRFTRNHPELTAIEWFNHMLFADERGSHLRKPGELRSLILQAVEGRNFSLSGGELADFKLMNAETEINSTNLGSRYNPIKLEMNATDTVSYNLTASLKSSSGYSFKYPATIKVEYVTGPLQGAVRWQNEAANPHTFTLNSEADTVTIPIGAVGECDEINRPDGSCQDFAYVQVINHGDTQPAAKKRFYLRIYPKGKGQGPK